MLSSLKVLKRGIFSKTTVVATENEVCLVRKSIVSTQKTAVCVSNTFIATKEKIRYFSVTFILLRPLKYNDSLLK